MMSFLKFYKKTTAQYKCRLTNQKKLYFCNQVFVVLNNKIN